MDPSTGEIVALRWRSAWLVLGWLLVTLVVFLSVTPQPLQLGEGNDKLGHFLAYAALAGWFSQLYRGWSRLGFGLGFVLLGVLLELIQALGKVRYFDGVDMLANAAGVVVALGLAAAGLDRVLQQFERLLRY